MVSTESKPTPLEGSAVCDQYAFEDRVGDHSVRRGNALRVLGEMVVAVMVASLVSVAVQWLIGRWHVPMPSYSPLAVSTVASAMLVLAACLIAWRNRPGVLATLLSWSVLSALTTVVLSMMLSGTRYYLAGVAGDNQFRTENVTRFADTTANVDFAYVDLPGYYPRGWFWLAGRVADLVNRPGWLVVKPLSILTMAVGVVLAYVVWRQVVSPALALLATVTVAGVATATWAAVEPYAWLFGALIPPLGVIAWRHLVCDVRRPRARGTVGGTAAVLLGATLGLLALFYTLLWLFLVEVLLIAAVIGVVLARRDGQPIRPALLRCLARIGVVAVISLPLTLVQWGPYLWSLYRHPVDVGGSLTYMPQAAAMFPIFHYPIDFAGVLALVGLLGALLRVRESVVARGVLLVVGAGYLYYAVSLAGALMNLTLLPFKIELVLDETLGCAGAFGLVDLLVVAHRRLPPRRHGVLVGGAALAALGMVGELQQAPTNLHDVVAQAYDSYYPSGATPLGGHDPSHWGAWNQPLHDAIATLTGKPEHDLVVLTTYQDFLSFWPYWNFLPSKIQYSNYLGQYDLRRTTVEIWARSQSSTELLAALHDPRWRTPEVFVFTHQPDGLHLQTTRSVFPSALDNFPYDIVFPAALFDTPDFTQTTTGPFTARGRARRSAPALAR